MRISNAFLISMACAFIAAVIAWGTHIVWAIVTLASDGGASAGQIILGAVGAFVPPVGVIHGILLVLGIGA